MIVPDINTTLLLGAGATSMGLLVLGTLHDVTSIGGRQREQQRAQELERDPFVARMLAIREDTAPPATFRPMVPTRREA